MGGGGVTASLRLLWCELHTSKSHSRSWKAVELGMIEVSWPLSTVPTREKVKCRIWLFNRGRFFFSSMANSYNTRHQVKEDHSGKWSKVDREKTTTEGLCERTICYIFLSLLISGFSDQFSLKQAATQHSAIHFPYTVTPQNNISSVKHRILSTDPIKAAEK